MKWNSNANPLADLREAKKLIQKETGLSTPNTFLDKHIGYWTKAYINWLKEKEDAQNQTRIQR